MFNRDYDFQEICSLMRELDEVEREFRTAQMRLDKLHTRCRCLREEFEQGCRELIRRGEGEPMLKAAFFKHMGEGEYAKAWEAARVARAGTKQPVWNSLVETAKFMATGPSRGSAKKTTARPDAGRSPGR